MGLLKIVLAVLALIYGLRCVAILLPDINALMLSNKYPNAKLNTATGQAFLNAYWVIGGQFGALALLNAFSMGWGSQRRFQVGLVNLVAWVSLVAADFFAGPDVTTLPMFEWAVPVTIVVALGFNCLEPGIFTEDKEAGRRQEQERAKRAIEAPAGSSKQD